MDLRPEWLLASLLVSTVGLGFFLYGKRAARLPQLVAGLVLMIYPAFVASTAWMLGLAGLVLAALLALTRAGY